MPNLGPCCAQGAWHAPCYVLEILNCFLHFVARLNKINMHEKYKFGKKSQKIDKFDANLMEINRKTIKMTMPKPTACRILLRALNVVSNLLGCRRPQELWAWQRGNTVGGNAY